MMTDDKSQPRSFPMLAASLRKKAPSKRGLQPLIRFEDSALGDAGSIREQRFTRC